MIIIALHFYIFFNIDKIIGGNYSFKSVDYKTGKIKKQVN